MATDLLDKLSAAHQALLRDAGGIAERRRERAFLVGGPVRDLLLERAPDDLDIVVEGDGMAVAQALARKCGGALTRHHAFQTAMVETRDALRIDVASARAERYPRPGMLPQVVAGSLNDDLRRRDFTINTMALALSADTWGELVDPCAARGDLRAGKIRAMHSRSFADDPTRILRALRFALRFGYRLEAQTHAWLRRAIDGGYLDRVSADRVRKEIRLSLAEAPVVGAQRLHEEGVLDGIAPGLVVDARHIEGALDDRSAWLDEDGEDAAGAGEAPPGWVLALACLAADLAPQARWQLVRRLGLSRAEREPLLDAGAPWREAAGRLTTASDAGDLVDALDGLSTGGLLVGAAHPGTAPQLRLAARRYLLELRHVVPRLNGSALLELGVPEGPAVGAMLRRLRRERLDGNTRDAADERHLVCRWLAAERHQ